MSDKIKVKPSKDQNFKEIEVSTKDWNNQTRRKINRICGMGFSENNDMTIYDACCDILELSTTLTEDDIFNLSSEEIQTIALRIVGEINKKK